MDMKGVTLLLIYGEIVLCFAAKASGQDDEDFRGEPTFDVEFVNVTVLVGQTAQLPCSIRNLGNYQVAWTDGSDKILTYENRRVVDDARFSIVRPFRLDWNLEIKDVQSGDHGQYHCRVNTSPVIQKEVALFVKVPPEISDSTGDMRVSEGKSVLMVCNATGVPQPEINWYQFIKSGDGREWREYLGFVGERFTISTVSRYYDGVYECEATNGIPPSATRKIRLTVIYAPEVQVVKGSEHYAEVGQDVTLECNITASPLAVSYWMYNSSEIVVSDKYSIKVSMADVHTISVTLHIRQITKSDFGEYYCLGANLLGLHEEKIFLKERNVDEDDIDVAIDDSFSSPRSLSVVEGENVHFVCYLKEQVNHVNITWRTDLENHPNQTCSIQPLERYSGEVALLANVSRYCRGNYSCVVENRGQEPVTRQTYLDVHFAPDVSFVYLAANDNKYQTIICIIRSNPSPSAVQWHKNNLILSTSWNKKYRIVQNLEKKSFVQSRVGELLREPFVTVSTLILKESEVGHFSYMCEAENYLGRGRSTISNTGVVKDKSLQDCENNTVPMCMEMYESVRYPNMFGHINQNESMLQINQFWPLVEVNCSSDLQSFLCHMFAPECQASGHNIPPCRNLCESVRSSCEPLMKNYGFNWPDSFNCDQFPALGSGQKCVN